MKKGTKWLTDEIEKCQLQFIRYTLNVNRRTPKTGLYGETGRFPLLNEIICNVFKYWLRIWDLSPNSLLHNAYVSNVRLYPTKSWVTVIEIISKKLYITRDDIYQRKIRALEKLRSSLKNELTKRWKHDLFDDQRRRNCGNKLRSYRLFKSDFRFEEYLLSVKSPKSRKQMTQLRLSSHHLHIETGRHAIPYKEPSDRICTYCNTKDIEDEILFVMKCSL